jgi:hypothetical protein
MECGGDSRRFVPDARLKCAGDKFSLVDCSVQRAVSVVALKAECVGSQPSSYSAFIALLSRTRGGVLLRTGDWYICCT